MNLSPSDGFPYYIQLVEQVNFKTLLVSNATFEWLASLSEEKSAYRYQPGKWSIKQIVGHMTDHERIMTYRALRFSRKDPTPLPGYDQEVLVNGARFDELSYRDLLQDFSNVRQATLSFMHALSEQQLTYRGVASGLEVSVLDVLKATVGHEIHHIRILKERYL